MKRISLVVVVSLAAAACGGSASETPWPNEPENVDLGPIGESKNEDAAPRGSASAKSPDAAPEAPSAAPAKPKVDPSAP